MITNVDLLAAWEAEQQAADSLSYEQKRRLVEGMYQLARQFGHFTEADLLEGLETTIAIATYINADVRPPAHRDQPRS